MQTSSAAAERVSQISFQDAYVQTSLIMVVLRFATRILLYIVCYVLYVMIINSYGDKFEHNYYYIIDKFLSIILEQYSMS